MSGSRDWLRQNALLLAGLGGELVLNLVLQKGWLDSVPDPLVGILCVIPLLLCVYGLWHNPAIQRFLRLLYNRKPKMLLALLIIFGAVLGGGIGGFAWWTINRQERPAASAEQNPPSTKAAPNQTQQPSAGVLPSPAPTATAESSPSTTGPPPATAQKSSNNQSKAAERQRSKEKALRDLDYKNPK